jgi:amino acid transporter
MRSHALKRAVLGRPIATAQEVHHRLSKALALSVFSSDAISSTAYATEEILIVLLIAGTASLKWAFPLSIAVAGLLAIVAISYQQTVHAYPSGGGSYIVSTANLGRKPGMLAASSLMIDYVMTVAVSVAAGVAAVDSAFPSLLKYRVLISVAIVVLMGLANLRGLKESGRLFALPTYAFIILCGGLIVVGLVRWSLGDLHPVVSAPQMATQGGLTLYLLLRAFSGGCSAMTGTEAISNGVPAFKPPEARNAGITLGVMAAILGGFLLGVTFLAQQLHLAPKADGSETILSMVGRSVYGNGAVLYFALQFATMAILFMGANTSFADFPRLSSILARDGLMPRQFMNRGDKLAFSNGIIGLAALSMLVIVVFAGDVTRMIPLYAVGVFCSFTLSQSGMVVHWFKVKGRRWRGKAAMNGFGALLTGVVLLVVLSTKFLKGAYIVLVAAAVLMLLFAYLDRHYKRVARALEPPDDEALRVLVAEAAESRRTMVVLFVSQVNELTARSLAIGSSLRADSFEAVTVSSDQAGLARLRADWQALGVDVPLRVLPADSGRFVAAAVRYVRSLGPGPHRSVVVVIPELVVEHRWENLLHNPMALRLKAALLRIPWVMAMNVPVPLRSVAQPSVREAEKADVHEDEAPPVHPLPHLHL